MSNNIVLQRSAKERELAGIFSKMLDGSGFYVADLRFHDAGRHSVLKVFLDKINYPDEQVSVGDCAAWSREFSERLDKENLIVGQYLLEVSSPGLDRSLATMENMEKSRGALVEIMLDAGRRTNEKIKKGCRGILESVDEAGVTLAVEGSGNVNFAFDQIISLNLVYEDKNQAR